jgi:hypothetical protein
VRLLFDQNLSRRLVIAFVDDDEAALLVLPDLRN